MIMITDDRCKGFILSKSFKNVIPSWNEPLGCSAPTGLLLRSWQDSFQEANDVHFRETFGTSVSDSDQPDINGYMSSFQQYYSI